MTPAMPRRVPWTMRRPRLEEWLGRLNGVPVRFLLAPPGYGKTTALVNYLRHASPKGMYCSIGSGASDHGVWATIGRAMHVKGRFSTHDDLIAALAKAGPVELALDCEDVPDASGIGAIAQLIDEAPEGVALLVASRSRAAFDAGRLVARGMASICDAGRLAFDAREVAHLANSCLVSFAHGDIPRLLDLTDGWPQVVNWVVRKAVEDGCNLAAAVENWRKHHGHLFGEFIATALQSAPEPQAALVRKLMTGFHCDDQHALQALEREGLFVIRVAHEYRPLRALSHGDSYHVSNPGAHPLSPLQVQLLGWFQAEVDGRPIKWIRRRDQQIFKYLALKPDGRAARAELAEIFWPEGERALVSRCLRTACSNIRKAIARVVGFAAVDKYFQADGDVSIDLTNVHVDVHGFTAYANDGDDEYEHGEPSTAYAHYRRAGELYRGNLLIGDAKEAWVSEPGAALERRYRTVQERIAESKPGLAVRASFAADVRHATG